jgi:formamidopyrimidine-DNA glycosylase
VETVRRGLRAAIVGRRVAAVTVRERRMRRQLSRSFAAALVGRRIDDVRRRAKYLLLDLDDDRVWLVHLGMSGTLAVVPAIAPIRVHTHVIVTLDDGRTLRFHDPRRFGLMRVGAAAELDELVGLGVEPLDAAFTPELLHRTAHRQRRA